MKKKCYTFCTSCLTLATEEDIKVLSTIEGFSDYFSDNRASTLIYTKESKPRKLENTIRAFKPLKNWPDEEVKNVIDVMEAIFQYRPTERASAKTLLEMPFFRNIDHTCLRR